MLDKNFRVVFSQSILDPANFEKYNIILFSQYESEKNSAEFLTGEEAQRECEQVSLCIIT